MSTAPSESKPCYSCFQSIDRRAAKCPYCHAYQDWRRQGLMWLLVCLIVVVFIFLIAATADILSLYQKHQRQQINHSSQVSVKGSKVFFGQKEGESIPVVIGELTNTSELTLDGCEVEVSFFDHNDQLIDSLNQNLWLTVPPHGTVTFKVTGQETSHVNPSEYAQHRILVRRAYER